MIKTYSGSGRKKTIWQYLGSVLSRSLFLWILFAQGVAWTEAAQTVEKTVSKNSNLGAVFSAEGYLDPLWALVVTPVIHWQHASCVVQTEFGWVVDTAGGGCAESAIFKCATMVYPYELQFQGRVFTGKLEPCEIHELPPPNGSGGSENTGWKITARTMGYQVLPEQATICVNQTASFYTTDLQGNLLTDPSNWTLTPQVGGAPTGPYPPGTSVFVPSITPGVPGVYKVKGTSTETGESDTATLTIFKVGIDSFVSEPGSEPGDAETVVLGYDDGRVTYKIEPSDFTADTAQLMIMNKNDVLVFKKDLTGKTGGVTYNYDWDGKWNQSPNDSPSVYAKPDNGPYKAQITITKGSLSCDSNEDTVNTRAKAIVESLWDAHGNIIKTKLESLGFDDVHVDAPPSKANTIAKAPLRLVYYAAAHGYHNAAETEFYGPMPSEDLLNLVRYTDLPTGLAYELVFMNCCFSNLNPNRDKFKAKFGARAYVGWDGEPWNIDTTAAGNTFMDKLLSDLLVYQAYLAAYDDSLLSGAKLRFTGDGTKKLNLK